MISVNIVTGFLGSGKTTLLNHLVAHPSMSNAVVLINEFGEVGLDHLLVESVTEDIVLLQSGCICCKMNGDLVSTLENLYEKRSSEEISAFDSVLIETTGLADPCPIVQVLMSNVDLTPNYKLDRVLTVLDGTYAVEQLTQYPEVLRQTVMADCLLISKTDLIDRQLLGPLREQLTKINPAASIHELDYEHVDVSSFLFSDNSESRESRVAQALEKLSTVDIPMHQQGDICVFNIAIDEAIEWDVFMQWMQSLIYSRSEQLLRIKGLVNVVDNPLPVVIHGVKNTFYPPSTLPTWPESIAKSKVVFFTKQLPQAAVEQSLQDYAIEAH